MSLINSVKQGDCFEYLPKISDHFVDMIITDLPYGKTALHWDVQVPLEQLWLEYRRILKPNGVVIFFGVEPLSSHIRLGNLEMYKYDYVWDKRNTTNYTNANKMPLRRHENILVFYKEQPTYNPQFEILKKSDYRYRKNGRGQSEKKYSNTVYGNIAEIKREETGKRHPNTILKFSNSNRNGKLHPTQKPVALYEFLIKTYSNEGDLVLDSFAGSGTLGEACINTNRNFLMIEKEKEYIDVINARINSLMNSNKFSH